MGNGMCERFNQSLLNMLGTLEEHQKEDWKSYVAPLVQAYNATRHESTGCSPYFLMFGRHPRLAIDAFLGLDHSSDEPVTTSAYIKKLNERLKFAFRTASREAQSSAARHKQRYDVRTRNSCLAVGDQVLVKNVGLKGKHKLADRWEQDVYEVKCQPNADIPVYVVAKPDGHGRKRTLHRNMLLPYVGMPGEVTHRPAGKERRSSERNTVSRQRSSEPSDVSDSDTTSTSSDSESDTYVIPQRRTAVRSNTKSLVSVTDSGSSAKTGSSVSLPSFVSGRTVPRFSSSRMSGSSSTSRPQSVQSGSSTSQTSGSVLDDSWRSQTRSASHVHVPVPPTPPTRPTRTRQPPAWIRSGDWVLQQHEAEVVFV